MKSVTVIGGGESGVGAALLAQKQGLEVFVSDFGKINETYKAELINNNIPHEDGGHDIERIVKSDLIVKSPGVPDTAPVLIAAKNAGAKVISEIEFGHRYYKGITLAITGSNGKTTTAGLLYHMINSAGRDVALGGNYGRSYARILAESNPEYMVLEISSFQLDDIETFSPHVGILLNITPDHLDRYDYKMSNYVASKFRITMNQGTDDYLIYNGDDVEISGAIGSRQGLARMISISSVDYENGIISKDGNSVFEMSIKGRHNLFNGRCAVEACRIIGMVEEEIGKGLATFVNLPHRLEPCGVIKGVNFINDSKATNVDSVFYALDAMKTQVIWIAGGTDKGNDYSPLIPLIKGRVKMLICLGVDNQKLKEFFAPHIPLIAETQSVDEVVKIAQGMAKEGDTVLLSPACASFDLFKNYMDRGDQFKEAVARMNE